MLVQYMQVLVTEWISDYMPNQMLCQDSKEMK